jgi:7,8-dihydropterin-6-yl-methyl-4-(beta-D-ribofuranosyl)aminobenzene 5'-phosphate synthase
MMLMCLKKIMLNKNNGRDVVFHLNPGMFYQRATTHDGQVFPFKKVPSINELEKNGASIVNSDDPRLLLDDMFYLSGEIPRVTEYEKGFPGHVRQLPSGEWEDDQWIMDERFLAVNVRDKGLVVFSACSHTQALFPAIPLYAVMGGFHLSGHTVEKIIPKTVKDMEQFNLKMIIPAHCTGWRAVNALGNMFGDSRVVPSAVGRIYNF